MGAEVHRWCQLEILYVSTSCDRCRAIYANSYNRFLSARSAYESSVVLGVFLAGDPNAQGLWIVNRANAESNFNSARQELNTIQIGAGILGVFLAYNLIDSYLSAKRNVAMDGFEIPLFEENKTT